MADVIKRISQHDPVGDPSGVVVLLHGGGEGPGSGGMSSWHPAYKRISYLHWCIKSEMASNGLSLWLLRFDRFHWDSPPEQPGVTQIQDVKALLDLTGRKHPGVPVILVGHSMGARVALVAARDSRVKGVIGLAPWWPENDSVEPLRGKHVAAATNPKDPEISGADVDKFLGRAEPIAASTAHQVLAGGGPGGPDGALSHGLVYNAGSLHGFIHQNAQRMVAGESPR